MQPQTADDTNFSDSFACIQKQDGHLFFNSYQYQNLYTHKITYCNHEVKKSTIRFKFVFWFVPCA